MRRAFAEGKGKATQRHIRRLAEGILGAPEGWLDTRKKAVKELVYEEMDVLNGMKRGAADQPYGGAGLHLFLQEIGPRLRADRSLNTKKLWADLSEAERAEYQRRAQQPLKPKSRMPG